MPAGAIATGPNHGMEPNANHFPANLVEYNPGPRYDTGLKGSQPQTSLMATAGNHAKTRYDEAM